MIINLYIPKWKDDELNVHIIEPMPEQITAEPEREPEKAEQAPETTSASKPYPVGSPEAAAAIERVKAAEKKRIADKTDPYGKPVKRGRKKKGEEE